MSSGKARSAVNTPARRLSLAGLALIGGFGLHAVVQEAPKALQADAVGYEDVAPFVRMGAAWGNRAEGAHGTFGVMPGEDGSPKHVHSGAYHAVVISGVMINPFEDETDPPHLGPGSYWYVPAGMEHVTACVSTEPCQFYFHAEGAFDFEPR